MTQRMYPPRTPAGQQLAAIKSPTADATTRIGYTFAATGNAHHHIVNGLAAIDPRRRDHNCAEAISYSYWRALRPSWREYATQSAKQQPQEGLSVLDSLFTSRTLACTVPLPYDGNYAITAAEIGAIASEWTTQLHAAGDQLRVMDWVMFAVEPLELDPTTNEWSLIFGDARFRTHHSVIVDEPRPGFWDSIIADHVSACCRRNVADESRRRPAAAQIPRRGQSMGSRRDHPLSGRAGRRAALRDIASADSRGRRRGPMHPDHSPSSARSFRAPRWHALGALDCVLALVSCETLCVQDRSVQHFRSRP